MERFVDTKAQIKWVNDVYIEGKKLCGILTEAVSDLESGDVEYAVVGIGINLTCDAFPPELKGNRNVAFWNTAGKTQV